MHLILEYFLELARHVANQIQMTKLIFIILISAANAITNFEVIFMGVNNNS
jgi:hypothetical protein